MIGLLCLRKNSDINNVQGKQTWCEQVNQLTFPSVNTPPCDGGKRMERHGRRAMSGALSGCSPRRSVDATSIQSAPGLQPIMIDQSAGKIR